MKEERIILEVVNKPPRSEWQRICQRPVMERASILTLVSSVLKEVKDSGEDALIEYSRRFDGFEGDTVIVSQEEISSGHEFVSAQLKSAIAVAQSNIEKFHAIQLPNSRLIETMLGVKCWQEFVAIEKIGLYIPGGTAPLFSTVLMLGVPARLAGCKELVLCTPPLKKEKSIALFGTELKIHPTISYVADLLKIDKVFCVGGAQAIAAMAYGTESVPKVYKIFGPGNQYVTAAKQVVASEGVAIDMPAGPSEVMILADESAVPEFVAADLLSQAEHGKDSQAMLVTNSLDIVTRVKESVASQLTTLERAEIAQSSLFNSKAIILDSTQDMFEFANIYAAEHLIVALKDADGSSRYINNAGSVFIGNFSPESVGDYASGTNHTLPTNSFARAWSGVTVQSFMKSITYQQLSRDGLKGIAAVVEEMALAENLHAHARAVSIRMQSQYLEE